MNKTTCPERALSIEVQRRQVQEMNLDQLRGVADSLIVAYGNTDMMLRAAMGRIAELESRQALVDIRKIQQQLLCERHGKLFGRLRFYAIDLICRLAAGRAA